MNTWRRLAGAALIAPAAVLMLSSCTAPAPGAPVSPGAPPATSGGGAGTSAAPVAPVGSPDAPATPGMPGPPAAVAPGAGGPAQGAAFPGLPEGPTTVDRPVPKVQRGVAAAEPVVSAPPVETDAQVAYPDGVRLEITEVSFTEEEGEGPGRFPGRELAVFSLVLTNGSARQLSLDTVVVTVLDPAGSAVPPVYVEGTDVRDFAGTVEAGATATARYAFAVPGASRSNITVVVDFDGEHTSAVFRGSLE